MKMNKKAKKIFETKKIKKAPAKRRLSSYFAYMTSFLIAAIIIFTMGYVFNHIKNLAIDYDVNIKSYSNSLSTLLSDNFEMAYNSYSLEKTEKLIQSLQNTGMLSYVYAVERRTNKVFFSTIPDIKGEDAAVAKGDIFLKFQNRNTKEIITMTRSYVLFIGMPVEKIAASHLNNLLESVKIFLAIFLFIGILASAVMSKIILNPLNELTKGVKEFANGNFDFRLNESKFSEINELVDAYNYMAFQLHDLYDSLELKVQERTLALERANQEIKETQAMMVHSEKMRSLGELVAGIAHEINNPVNFIHGNIMILDKYVKDMFSLIDLYIANEASISEEELKKINKTKADIDIDFIRDDVKDLIKSCVEGTERTKNIVLDLKNFSRMEEMVLTQFNIPKEIDTTLNILNNKYKNRITVVKDYEPNVPKIEAYGGQLNQVFMNILDNAQYAIKGEGTVTISVKQDGDNVIIKFSDTGEGIKKEDLRKVFEPFFTTKPVGQGTGLGMSITYRVIKNHNGEIFVDSEVGKGTTFTIKLPVNYAKETGEDSEKTQEC